MNSRRISCRKLVLTDRAGEGARRMGGVKFCARTNVFQDLLGLFFCNYPLACFT